MVEITDEMRIALERAMIDSGRETDAMITAVAPLIEAQADRRAWYDLERTHRAIPDEFCLDPPDGGDVKPWEAAERMAQALASARAAAIEEAAKDTKRVLGRFACELSEWKDEHHDCDCPPHDSCGCRELRGIIQAMEFHGITEEDCRALSRPVSERQGGKWCACLKRIVNNCDCPEHREPQP